MFDDDCITASSIQQHALEKKILPLYLEVDQFAADEGVMMHDNPVLKLQRELHVAYLHGGLGHLPASFSSLDASRPWICYWILHSLALLEAPLVPPPATDHWEQQRDPSVGPNPSSSSPPDATPRTVPTESDIISFLASCQSFPGGGYGGGPMQIAHLAPTYASVCALVTLGSDQALSSINRGAIQSFLHSLCIPKERGGGFCIHQGGEGDLRACYIAMAVAHMLCIPIQDLVERSGLVGYVKSCQTYEGGLGGEPGAEAHGGYTFCGLAALMLTGTPPGSWDIDIPSLLRWAAQRQGSCEGGLNGRTNKLVDGCYSFWEGGLFPMLQSMTLEEISSESPSNSDESSIGEMRKKLTKVPELPIEALNFLSPSDQAQSVLGERTVTSQQRVAEALVFSEEADQMIADGRTAREAGQRSRQARVLLDKAGAAQGSVELANENLALQRHAAVSLFPPNPADDDDDVMEIEGDGLITGPLFHREALQLWILRCCQAPGRGGLRDKPGKAPDYYHSCYCLSGLSAAQYGCSRPGGGTMTLPIPLPIVLGPFEENLLAKTDLLCNVVETKLKRAREFYSSIAVKLEV